MITIRLFRVGKKNQPLFKIVVTDKRNPPRGGNFLEQVGFYNPLTKEKHLKKERIKFWLSRGAKTSSTLHNLLVKEGILQGPKIPVHKKPKKKEKPKEAPKEEKKIEKVEEEKREKENQKEKKESSKEKISQGESSEKKDSKKEAGG